MDVTLMLLSRHQGHIHECRAADNSNRRPAAADQQGAVPRGADNSKRRAARGGMAAGSGLAGLTAFAGPAENDFSYCIQRLDEQFVTPVTSGDQWAKVV
jgi:hypothetical protein